MSDALYLPPKPIPPLVTVERSSSGFDVSVQTEGPDGQSLIFHSDEAPIEALRRLYSSDSITKLFARIFGLPGVEIIEITPTSLQDDLAALDGLSKTALKNDKLDQIAKRRPVPHRYHDEPEWDDGENA